MSEKYKGRMIDAGKLLAAIDGVVGQLLDRNTGAAETVATTLVVLQATIIESLNEQE